MNKIKGNIKTIALSRTDAIGDSILSLPIAGYLKKNFPDINIDFICQKYTKAIIKRSEFINQVILEEELTEYFETVKPDVIIMIFPDKEISALAKKFNIKIRIGTSHRWWHWLHLNNKVNFSRKSSELHESQLNFKLLEGMGIKYIPKKDDIPDLYGFRTINSAKKDRFKLIFHPKSRGSARDWSLSNYAELSKLLSNEKFEIHITGTEEEEKLILKENPDFFNNPGVINQTGKFSLEEFVDFISSSDGLIACSTGPLHIASAMGIFALGLYPPIRPMHPGRWAPLGKNAHFLTGKNECQECPDASNCECMKLIQAESVAKMINSHFNSPNLQA